MRGINWCAKGSCCEEAVSSVGASVEHHAWPECGYSVGALE